jgi:hypothetical protein
MLNKVIIFLFFISTCLSAENSLANLAYLGSQPLGEDISISNAKNGPSGSLMISSPGIGQKNVFSLGTGLSYVELNSSDMLQIPFSLSYTLRNDFEITGGVSFLKLDYENVEDEKGIGDIYTMLKYNYFDYEFKSSVILGLIFPTGDEDLLGKENKLDITINFPFEKEFQNFILNLNAGVSFLDIDSDREDETYNFGVSINRAITKKIGISLESMYQYNNDYKNLFAIIGAKIITGKKSSISFVVSTDLIDDDKTNDVDFLFSSGYSVNF